MRQPRILRVLSETDLTAGDPSSPPRQARGYDGTSRRLQRKERTKSKPANGAGRPRPGNASAIRRAAEALQGGSLVIMPTDTVYGLAADARLPGAEEKLYEAKSRDRRKPIPLLAGSVADVKAFGAVLGKVERQLAKNFWPGPLTLVLAVGDRTEGFRIPNHATALALLRECGGVLRVTSANVSGEPAALIAADAVSAIGRSAEVVLDAGPSPGGTPSTVAQVVDGGIKILREGALSRALLEKACQSVR